MTLLKPIAATVIASTTLAVTMTAPAHGGAITGTFHDVQSTIDSGVLDYACFEGIEGNGTTTDVIDGRFTETANGFHVHGVVQREYTLAFGDGTHILGHVTEHFNFNASTLSTTDTEPSQESATVYAADGDVIGTIRLHGIFHLRYRDTNTNGTPDAGEITASVERLHISCP